MLDAGSFYRADTQAPEPEEPQGPTGKWLLFKVRHPELARMVVGAVILLALAAIVATLAGLSLLIGLCIEPRSSFDEAFGEGASILVLTGIGLFACYWFGMCWSLKP